MNSNASRRRDKAKVSTAAIVVTFDRKELLAECLQSIRMQTNQPDKIIVINNASTDGTKEYLAQLDWSGLLIYNFEVNTGGAGGFSKGMELATNLSVDLAWIMDDDCIPAPDALEHLINMHEALDAAGKKHSFLCSRAVDSSGNACNHPVPSTATNGSLWPRWADLAELGCVLVDECTFVSVLIPCDYIRRVGLPLRKMFIWGDDVEYTRRLSQLAPGVFVGKSQVLHKRALTGQLSIFNETSETRVGFYRHLYRNRIYLYRTYFTKSRYIAYLLQVLKDLFFLSIYLQFNRAWIVGRGISEGLTFHPVIEYVDQTEPVDPLSKRGFAPSLSETENDTPNSFGAKQHCQ